MTSPAVPVVKLTTAADMIAFLPVLAGMPVHDSLVIAPFEGKNASRAMRIRVEAEPTTASARSLASIVLGNLARMEHCDAVVVAVYRSEPFAQCVPRWHAALDLVLERLRSAGFHIKEAAIVADDGWLPLFDGDLDRPRPIAELDAAKQDVPEHAAVGRELYESPAADPELTRIVTDLVLDRVDFAGETDAFGRFAQTEPPNPIDVLEDALSGDPTHANALTLARLIAQIDSEGAVDRTVLQIAFGRDTGAWSWASTLQTRTEAADAGLQPIELLLQRGDDRRTRRLSDLLTGQTRETPSAERLQAAAVLLGRAISHCALPDRAWAMCALAWVRWALGLASSAFELLGEAARVDPANSQVPVLRTAFLQLTPEWLYRSPSANRRDRRRADKSRG